jgi:hypothetical protein
MAMTANPRVTVELVAGADPIRGSLEHPDGRRQPFWGWLELIDELRRISAAEPERYGAPPAPTGQKRYSRRKE